MTEDQIERAVERKTDWLDAALMSGKISQAQYDAEQRKLTEWANAQYRAR